MKNEAWPACVIGIGIDLIENERIRESLEKFGDRFKKRVFLPDEQRYCDKMPDPAMHYAGRFAVKEAVSKAFGTGIGSHLGWLDIEVIRNGVTGEPSVRLHGRGEALAAEKKVTEVLASLSHTQNYSAAQVVMTGLK